VVSVIKTKYVPKGKGPKLATGNEPPAGTVPDPVIPVVVNDSESNIS
jgi:hypothetical protein